MKNHLQGLISIVDAIPIERGPFETIKNSWGLIEACFPEALDFKKAPSRG